MKDEYKALYEAVSNKFIIGTFEEFEARMQSPEDRKRFYDAVSKKGFSLGGYDDYEERLKKKRLLRNLNLLALKKVHLRFQHLMYLFLKPYLRVWNDLKKLDKQQNLLR